MPSTAITNGLINWTYGDWRRQSTLFAQIERLTLHLEEVEKYAFESQNKGNRLSLHESMIPRLEANLARLQGRRNLKSASLSGRVGQTAKFKRGSGA